ncbi:nucleotidyl transferase AbiEii/AbiGii toxin family protein [Chryseobacterium taklimakanense]|uniref:nucleotidyl transferase AbiEii/AbiGii toxin family protein n=1 Tax=Chryseobacterium taklimakanense TaxID=536441 RepID=UPI000F5E6E91|nr:nucleotidyl transferase AbiEii/AbiGii toxin family protein [Chryseobacterium taklimakanense]AZI22532.1 nucleotidyl transferase AbiEii/AbiGii toxin family protein [Chryseobacterium taklimakanense]
MRLHTDKKLFRDAVRFTAQQMNIPEIYIEKDYWVCYALYLIFSSEAGKYCVFKGGTALSKCYKIIDRFSEDIDLVIMKGEDENPNQLKNKLKAATKVLELEMPEVSVSNITQKMGMNRKTAHTYSKEFQGNYGQVRDVIIVEATWLGYFEPYETKYIQTFISDVIAGSPQKEMIAEFGLEKFEVNVLKPERTFCEKIMSLVRFSYSEDYLADLKSKIRHTYDLHKMLQLNEISKFLNSNQFETMLNRVRQDDLVSFKNNNEWLRFHPKDSRFFKDLDQIWSEVRLTYSRDFRNLVYGDFPDPDEVEISLDKIRRKISSTNWNI